MSASSRRPEGTKSSPVATRKWFQIEEDSTSTPKRSAAWMTLCASTSISLVVHAVLLAILSLIYFNAPIRSALESLFTVVIDKEKFVADDFEFEIPVATEPAGELLVEEDAGGDEEPSDELAMAVAAVEASAPESTSSSAKAVTQQARIGSTASAPTKVTSRSKESAKNGTKGGGGDGHADHFVGRSGGAKAGLLKRMGGTDASEAAVARGLVWLKNHQWPDGSWNFDHINSTECTCTMPGRLSNNPNGATAMALLAFLGAGQTHLEGNYQAEVGRGLDYLKKGGTPVGKGLCFYGNLQGPPTYYTHGLVTIALSEAFAMTHDAELRPAVAGAIEFLVATQHTQGGWRYFPGQPGDTSVVAWELMALKSAQFSRISVPPKVFGGIDRFLGSVSSMRGSQYAYLPDRKNNPTPSMTAAGLLCRMYLDWNETSGGLRAGVHFLDEHGPDPDDMYYNYYATQVLHHWGGDEWDRWNKVMREHLINTQIRRTHADGSWDVADRHGNMGGRLYMTSLALLTLEVYYRHLPLYQKDRIEIPLKPAEAAAK